MPNCVGLADGCHINLATAPAMDDAGAFRSWKGRYGLLVFAIVDHEYRFRYLHYGYPASSGDKRVQRVIEPMTNPTHHFGAMEYVLGDSGLTAGRHCVIMYVKASGNATLKGRKVSSYRVL